MVTLCLRIVLADWAGMEILYLSIYLLHQLLRINITNISSNDVLSEVVAINTAYLLVILNCHHWVDDTLQAFLNKTATAKVCSSLNEGAINVLQGELRVTLNSFSNMYSLFVGLFPSLWFRHHRFQRETNVIIVGREIAIIILGRLDLVRFEHNVIIRCILHRTVINTIFDVFEENSIISILLCPVSPIVCVHRFSIMFNRIVQASLTIYNKWILCTQIYSIVIITILIGIILTTIKEQTTIRKSIYLSFEHRKRLMRRIITFSLFIPYAFSLIICCSMINYKRFAILIHHLGSVLWVILPIPEPILEVGCTYDCPLFCIQFGLFTIRSSHIGSVSLGISHNLLLFFFQRETDITLARIETL